MNSEQINILHSLLGNSKPVGTTDIIFMCPFCKHYKPKLQIHMTFGKWRCWVCNKRGAGIVSLLKALRVPDSVIDKFKDANVLLQNKAKLKQYNDVALPEHFLPLYKKSNHPNYKFAYNYVISRGLTPYDILRYNIGYVVSGEYSGMIIIPSYDLDNNLNFFVGRSFLDSDFKHKNPIVSKNIVGFENQINWNLPVYICEGAFDAISIKRNAIPLFGKAIPEILKSILLSTICTDIYLCLDADALVDAVEVAEELMNNNKQVHIVELNGKDPNEIGYQNMLHLIDKSPPITFYDIIKYKLSL